MLGSVIFILLSTLEYFENLFVAFGLYLDLNYATWAYVFIAVSSIVTIVIFTFKGIGLFVLSKRQGVSHAWLSFVPFASYVQMGRLIGEVRLFGSRTKHLGLFVAISSFVTQASSIVLDILLYLEPFKMLVSTATFDEAIVNTVNYALDNMTPLMNALDIISTFASIINIVLEVFLIIAFFRYFEPKHPTLYALLSIFLDLTGIFVFVVRKHDKVNYYEKQRKYYENLYRERYQGGAGQTRSSSPQTDNPFTEYSTKTDDVFTEYSQKSQQSNNPYSGYQNPYSGTQSGNSKPNNDNQDEDLF